MQPRYLIAALILVPALWLITRFSAGEKTQVNPSVESKVAANSRQPTAHAQIVKKLRAPTQHMLTEEEFIQAVTEDKYCTENGDYAEKFLPEKADRRTLKYRALLKGANPNRDVKPDPCMMAFLVRDREEALKYSSMSSDKACVFILALIKTDQFFFEGRRAVSNEENEEGLRLLANLHAQDPENGIYSYFRIGALADSHSDQLDATFQDFFASTKFENPLIPLLIELRELGRENGTAFLYSTDVYSGTSIPDYGKVSSVIFKWLRSQPRPEAWPWMERSVAFLEKINAKQLSEPFVLTFETSILKGFSLSIWNENGGGDDKPYLLTDDGWKKLFRQTIFGPDGSDNNEYVSSDNCAAALEASRKMLPRYYGKFIEAMKRWRG